MKEILEKIYELFIELGGHANVYSENLVTKVYPAYNHPEAPPVCFDCLPEEIKKELNQPKPKRRRHG